MLPSRFADRLLNYNTIFITCRGANLVVQIVIWTYFLMPFNKIVFKNAAGLGRPAWPDKLEVKSEKLVQHQIILCEISNRCISLKEIFSGRLWLCHGLQTSRLHRRSGMASNRAIIIGWRRAEPPNTRSTTTHLDLSIVSHWTPCRYECFFCNNFDCLASLMSHLSQKFSLFLIHPCAQCWHLYLWFMLWFWKNYTVWFYICCSTIPSITTRLGRWLCVNFGLQLHQESDQTLPTLLVSLVSFQGSYY